MNIYTQRRNKLIDLLPDNSVCYIFAGDKVMMTNDESYPFFVDRNFFYLTGLKEEGAILKILKINNRITETLFILPFSEYLAKWVGGRIEASTARKISGVESVFETTDFDDDFAATYNLQRSVENFKIFTDLYRYEAIQDDKAAMKFVRDKLNKYPSLCFKDIFPLMKKLRLIKDEGEIADIKKAIDITNEGIKKMMAAICDGMNERVMEGIFNFNLTNYLSSNSFKSICASGIRATILHYVDNKHKVKDGELFLCDLGATFNEYQADISRTFPVNGHFTARQKEIYEVVLNAQKLVFEKAKPGETLRGLQKIVLDYYEKELPKHNLNLPVSEYYFHGVSHQLGLDTHDFSDRNDVVLEPGMIISNEPGLYIEKEAIGIRIEDDLLITEDGNVNLSSDIIKEVADIEAYMAKYNENVK